MGRASILTATLAAVGAGMVLAGCSVGITTSDPPVQPHSGWKTQDGRAELPPQFPLPEGSVTLDGMWAGNQISVPVVVRDPEAAYAFWQRELGPAGYTVTSVRTGGALGTGVYEIRYRGLGCGGDSLISMVSTQAAVQCELD